MRFGYRPAASVFSFKSAGNDASKSLSSEPRAFSALLRTNGVVHAILRGHSVEACRGDAVAGTRIFRGSGDAVAGTRIFRGGGDGPRNAFSEA